MLGGSRLHGGIARAARRLTALVQRSSNIAAASQKPEFRVLPGSHDEWSNPQFYAATRRQIDEAWTLPGPVYHHDEFHTIERERIFKASWVAAGEVCDLRNHGDVMPVNIAGTPIILANNKGKINAFHNVCRHRGAKLVSEKCSKQRTILCPYHRWSYALDGRLMATPHFDNDKDGKRLPEHVREAFSTHHVKNFDKASMGLLPVRCDSALGIVFVNVNEEAPPLLEWLGDLMPMVADYEATLGVEGEGLVAVDKKVYDVQANWKVLIENYLEYYHLPAVHPELCDVSGVDEHRRAQGKGMYMGFATDPLSKGGTPLDPGRLPFFPTLKPHHKEMAFHVAIFPNTFFSLYPDAIFRIILSPQSATRTVEHATFMTHKEAKEAPDADKLLKETLEFWDLINTQDITICESVQAGTSGDAYQGGRFSFRFEEPVHRFQNMVIDKMLADEATRYRVPDGDNDFDPVAFDQPRSVAAAVEVQDVALASPAA